jgi:hypothetical protein
MVGSNQPTKAVDEPNGYQEIGETLAQAVAEGVKKLAWAVEIAKMLGYTTAETKAWIKHYSKLHAKELDKMERTRQRKLRKIERWERRRDELIRRPLP